MCSSVLFLFSALIIFSASGARVYQEKHRSQFAIDDMENKLDEQDQNQTQEMTKREASVVNITVGTFGLESILVPDFAVGRSVEVRFITPSTGRFTMDLVDASYNVILHVNPRWDTRVFALFTYYNKCWEGGESPSGFDFSSGVPMTIRVEA
uniref:Galectin n=1 Tax=Amphimedon queenslandica TaxID=400682 RepID=A0A1X7UKR2_AMPQE